MTDLTLFGEYTVPAAVPGAEPEPVFTVIVHGRPAPQGSKDYIGKGRMVESSAYVKPWREDVVAAALRVRGKVRGWQPLTGPLEAEMVFTITRPKSHFGTGRNAGRVKPSAPLRPTATPDLSKLARSTEDALTTAGVYRDDALLVGYRRLAKHYTTDHGAVPGVLDVSGCVIRLWRVGGEVTA